jgi:hypothetical protein
MISSSKGNNQIQKGKMARLSQFRSLADSADHGGTRIDAPDGTKVSGWDKGGWDKGGMGQRWDGTKVGWDKGGMGQRWDGTKRMALTIA